MLTPVDVVNEYYLEVRCKLLEIAAIMDRYDRAVQRGEGEAVDDDPRLAQCREALALLNRPQEEADRAEQVALIFTDHS